MMHNNNKNFAVLSATKQNKKKEKGSLSSLWFPSSS